MCSVEQFALGSQEPLGEWLCFLRRRRSAQYHILTKIYKTGTV